jgi:hypothetical protein
VKILDVSAGNRAVWFNKKHSDALYLDIRPEVQPDVIADSRALPANIGWGFDLIVFDPPHKNNGQNGNMSKNYGWHTAEEIRRIVAETAKETHRISRSDALMAFKWNDNHVKLSSILELLSPWWEPLFGHGVSHQQRSSSTFWVMLRRRRVTNDELPSAPTRRPGEL